MINSAHCSAYLKHGRRGRRVETPPAFRTRAAQCAALIAPYGPLIRDRRFILARQPRITLALHPGYGPLRLLRVVAAFFAGKYLLGDQARVLPDRCLDAGCDVGIVAQERFCVLAALADALAVMGEP